MSEPVFDANGWATIDSAPSDGQEVWVWSSAFGEPCVRGADGRWWELRKRAGELTFTHWQPLQVPKPPVGT